MRTKCGETLFNKLYCRFFIYPFLCGTNHNSLSVVVSYFRERKDKQPLEQLYRLATEIHIIVIITAKSHTD